MQGSGIRLFAGCKDTIVSDWYKINFYSSPVFFPAIRLTFELDTDATEEQMASVKKLAERYCVVYQTLANGLLLKLFINHHNGNR